MASDKKIIGVCLTKLQANERINFVETLYNLIDKTKYKLMVFNSFADFYYDTEVEDNCKSVYDLINYDLISCIITDTEYIRNPSIIDDIVSRAKSHGKPIILINGSHSDCICVNRDYEYSFKCIVRHLLSDHNVKDPCFISGYKGLSESNVREQYYKDVMAEHNMPIKSNRFFYGDFYEEPVYRILDELYAANDMPDAFICANDVMAFAVYDKLKEFGIGVGTDILVTGFDGLLYTTLIRPYLTTCRGDETDVAATCIKVIDDVFNGTADSNYTVQYNAVIAESCGCKMDKILRNQLLSVSVSSVVTQLRYAERARVFEEKTFELLDGASNEEGQTNLYSMWSTFALKGAYICIRQNFATYLLNDSNESLHSFSDKFLVITSEYNRWEVANDKLFNVTDIIPHIDDWMEDDTICCVMPIITIGGICGHYVMRTDDIRSMAHRYNRTSRAINIVANESLSRFRIKNLSRMKNDSSINVNPTSGLPNLKGAVSWFNDFASEPANHKKAIMVSLYWIPRYKDIYETYGVDEIEETVCYLGESLNIANAYQSYVAHIAEDEFIVINYVDNEYEISNIVNNGTNVFFSMRDSFDNKKRIEHNESEYTIEVNCGCTVVYKGWNQDLISLIKLARAEMFVNRFKYGHDGVVTETIIKAREDYNSLKLLLENNLFQYFFQPIIDVKNSEIYAYEALMRTDKVINMSPLDILTTAGVYQKLYDIERATMFNVMEHYNVNTDAFDGHKVFINSIPGYFLKSEDRETLKDAYAHLLDKFVFEITEVGTASDEEVNIMKNLSSNDLGIPLAIDDYGTGHSNIVNLLRYKPQVIKIDRYLITNIDNDQNKQMFVAGTIDFARANNILVLAEGVETQAEFKEVIRLGVDLVQGYYTGKPAPVPMTVLPDFVKNDIDSVASFIAWH